MKRKSLHTVCVALFVSGLFVGLFSCTEETDPPKTNPYNPRLKFEQVDYTVGYMEIKDSAWGSVVLTYKSVFHILYFNLAVNNQWIIQNVPVLFDPQNEGADVSYTYYFDLGVSNGTNVTELKYAFELTTDVRTTMPGDFRKAPVVDRHVFINSGVQGGVNPIIGAPPTIEIGDRVVGTMWGHLGIYFPNQDCGDMECVPAAVSNSLNFLNDKNNLGMGKTKMDITTMKDACGFKPAPPEEKGCPAWEWPNLKDAYMKKHKYPITTQTHAFDFDHVIDEIKRGQDVEVQCTWVEGGERGAHCAALVAIAKLANGKYVLYIGHDTAQGEKGGTRVEKTTFDPGAGKFEGGWLFHDSELHFFTVECPK